MCWGVFYGPECGLFWWMFHWNLGRKCLLLLLDEEFHQCQLDQAHWLYCSHHLRLYCFLPAWSISYWQGCAVLHLVAQSCLTLCDPMDCSPPGSSVHGDSPGKNAGVGCHWQGYEALNYVLIVETKPLPSSTDPSSLWSNPGARFGSTYTKKWSNPVVFPWIMKMSVLGTRSMKQ